MKFSKKDEKGLKEKMLKPRDGHSMELMEEEERIIIFGGDRHTIAFNDVIMVDLKQLFND